MLDELTRERPEDRRDDRRGAFRERRGDTPRPDFPISNLHEAVSCEWQHGSILCIYPDGSRIVLKPVGVRRRRRRSVLRRLLGLERRRTD